MDLFVLLVSLGIELLGLGSLICFPAFRVKENGTGVDLRLRKGI
jgi:hypothetical protein